MGPGRIPDALQVRLLGRPRLVPPAGDPYEFRSRKSWAVLAYLVLADRPPSRSRLAALLFADADDPGRALRWSLAEIRRGLGPAGSVDGDPVVLRLPEGSVVDVDLVLRGGWAAAVGLPGFGGELLEGMTVRGAAAFETWLLAEQRRAAAASEAILHEAALGSMARGALGTALGYAVRAAAMRPLDENHQALVIRLYRLTGDDAAAARQHAACVATFERELGVAPGAAVQAAIRETRYALDEPVDDDTVAAMIEAGQAAVAAGALDTGVRSLRGVVRLADRGGLTAPRVRARLILGEALIHALGGLDEEGLATLYEADRIALDHGLSDAVAQARAELGYVDFLRARYDRAELWLTDALAYAGDDLPVLAKATTYLGSVHSDRGDQPRAAALLHEAVRLSRAAADPRREAYALAMLGRTSLFQGELDRAGEQLDASIALAEAHQWLAFVPWPQALRGEVQLTRGDPAGASVLLRQAFARAGRLGDPCWEAMCARALALVAEATGEPGRAFELLDDARARGRRLADPYVWLDCYILDAQCELGLRHGHPDTRRWVGAMQELAARTGMRGLARRSLRHGAALGNPGDAALLDGGTP
ncbi:BTAD domain-containing putative transcriptional regulator [Micromonosporaceae bacterium Da 78-11]